MPLCEFCNKNVSIKGIHTHTRFCDSNPSREYRTSPFKGKKHSVEVKEFLRQKAVDEYKNGKLCKLPNWQGVKHTHESKQKISSSMMGNRNANHRGDRQSYFEDIRMDSSWEVLTAKYFRTNNISFIYSEKGFMLSNGSYYYPDFFIYDVHGNFSHLVEVKGYFREANKIKFERFKNEYNHIVVELWDKVVLKSKNIL